MVIADSGKPRNLIGSKYNERRSETDRALELLQKNLDIGCLAELNIYRHNYQISALPSTLRKRASTS